MAERRPVYAALLARAIDLLGSGHSLSVAFTTAEQKSLWRIRMEHDAACAAYSCAAAGKLIQDQDLDGTLVDVTKDLFSLAWKYHGDFAVAPNTHTAREPK